MRATMRTHTDLQCTRGCAPRSDQCDTRVADACAAQSGKAMGIMLIPCQRGAIIHLWRHRRPSGDVMQQRWPWLGASWTSSQLFERMFVIQSATAQSQQDWGKRFAKMARGAEY